MTAMEAFHKRVPNIGMSEYRSFTALGIEGLPRAEYGCPVQSSSKATKTLRTQA